MSREEKQFLKTYVSERPIPGFQTDKYVCRSTGCLLHAWVTLTLLFLFAPLARTQQATSPKPSMAVDNNSALQVNWLYGAFVPKVLPLEPLTPHERWKLYTRMTYSTWGIYIKIGLFTMSDQIGNTPSEWKQTPAGFAKRLGTREAQFVLQNSLTALGDTAAGWEIRYDRCRCNGFWSRNWHAVMRNFVTYGGASQSLRPQVMPYAAAVAGAVTSASWQPGTNLVVKGYQGAIMQVAVGIGVNWIAEFAPDIKRILHIENGKATVKTGSDIKDNECFSVLPDNTRNAQQVF